MIIALDYDNTYTADPKLWTPFIEDALFLGHTVIIATNRGPNSAGPITEPMPVPIVYCNNRPKREACREAGYEVNIWIDDMPHLVDFGNVNINGLHQ